MDTINNVVTQFGVNWHALIAQLVNFLLVAWLLYRFAFKPVLRTLDERKKTIAEGLQYTEDMRVKLAQAEEEAAHVMKKASQEAIAVVNEARHNAKQYMDQKTEEAAQKTESMLKGAEGVIAREKEAMVAEVRKEVAQMVVQTTEKILSKKLTEKQKSSYNDEAVKMLVN